MLRECLHEERFQPIFAKRERYRLLELLLAKMICPVGSRIQEIASVGNQLEKIQQWEQNARLLPVGKDGLTAISRFKQRSAAAARVASENAQAQDLEASNLEIVKASLLETVDAEVRKIADELKLGRRTAPSESKAAHAR